jgi:hypothetical protein
MNPRFVRPWNAAPGARKQKMREGWGSVGREATEAYICSREIGW